MVKFMHDPIIYPKESSWFGEMNEKGEIKPMEETKIYKENKFGLKTLNDQSRIAREEIDGVHLMFRNDHIQDIFVNKGLNK
jgi:palmitoyl-protein thioesterase